MTVPFHSFTDEQLILVRREGRKLWLNLDKLIVSHIYSQFISINLLNVKYVKISGIKLIDIIETTTILKKLITTLLRQISKVY